MKKSIIGTFLLSYLFSGCNYSSFSIDALKKGKFIIYYETDQYSGDFLADIYARKGRFCFLDVINNKKYVIEKPVKLGEGPFLSTNGLNFLIYTDLRKSDKLFTIYNYSKGSKIIVGKKDGIDTHWNNLRRAEFFDDSTLIVAINDELYSVSIINDSFLLRLKLPGQYINEIAISPDHKVIALACKEDAFKKERASILLYDLIRDSVIQTNIMGLGLGNWSPNQSELLVVDTTFSILSIPSLKIDRIKSLKNDSLFMWGGKFMTNDTLVTLVSPDSINPFNSEFYLFSISQGKYIKKVTSDRFFKWIPQIFVDGKLFY